ncbi:hypothetical protein [Nocardia sp. AG03]|uniref:hypothetical protein n=1 Tax=Nocardia sp. AG03 TaxID=3025312 RepID=UPI0024188881|nr:hypothetical protein [Nocardia sp. AG03]
MTVVDLRDRGGLWTLAPEGTPLVTDAEPGLDVLVLEVVGGHLSWGLLSDEVIPGAVLDDGDAAQDWLWAVYGESVALAVADGHPHALTARPELPELVTDLRRLAYAHWVTRWWPASTLDGIPALDAALLDSELAELTERCEMVLAGVDARGLDRTPATDVHELRPDVSGGGAGVDPADADRSTRLAPARPERRDDYALAAGGAVATDGVTVARGTGGWDWRRCPPGLLDASEQAVSWAVSRAAGVSTVRVSVVAAPDCREPVPAHLWPFARVRTEADTVRSSGRSGQPSASGQADIGATDRETTQDLLMALRLQGDSWVGSRELPKDAHAVKAVRVFVPGVGPNERFSDESEQRERIRHFARQRLTGAHGLPLLAAEAAAEDGDF